MAQELKKDGPPQAAATPAKQAATNLSLGEATKLMSTIVQNMRRQWLESAVKTATVLKNGQAVNRGTFEDLRFARENYEELERARQFLLSIDTQAAQTGGTAEINGGG